MPLIASDKKALFQDVATRVFRLRSSRHQLAYFGLGVAPGRFHHREIFRIKEVGDAGVAGPRIAAVEPCPNGGVSAAAEKSLRFDPNYDDREGYDPAFLGDGLNVPMPAAPDRDAEMYKVDGAVLVLKYHHYSLAMNRDRRLQMWSAVNVDYDPAVRSVKGRQTFGTDRWIGDPRIPAAIQIMDPDFYQPAGQIDRGHIVRREDNAWGATPEALEFANSDTFHWTNAIVRRSYDQAGRDRAKKAACFLLLGRCGRVLGAETI